MKELPKYAFLTNSVGFTGMKVIQLERPYMIASIHEYRRDDERVEEYTEDIAQERYPIAKVKGYSIFLTMFTSLEPNNNSDFQRAVLNDMADFVLTERIQKKPGQFMKCEESGKVEKKILQASERRKVFRERKKRE